MLSDPTDIIQLKLYTEKEIKRVILKFHHWAGGRDIDLRFFCALKKFIGNTGIFTHDTLVIYPLLGNIVYKLQNHRFITMQLSKFQHTQRIVIINLNLKI